MHLAAVTATVKVIIDRALYLPADWAADEERREVSGLPEEIAFATKPQQALAMVTDALATGVKARWFAGDEVYCGRELRRGLRSLGLGYTVGIAASYQVTDGAGNRWEARKLINKVRPGQWMRRQTGHGTKGTRECDWAWLDVRPDDTPDENEKENMAGTSVLVARRHRYTGEVSYFRCWAPSDVSLGTLRGSDLPQVANRGGMPLVELITHRDTDPAHPARPGPAAPDEVPGPDRPSACGLRPPGAPAPTGPSRIPVHPHPATPWPPAPRRPGRPA